MENQSPTPKLLNDNKTKVMQYIKDNLNYIYVVLLIIANCLISLLNVNAEGFGFRFPDGIIAWVAWFTQIAVTTLIGVLILNAFRRQGIKNGHKEIKDVYQNYIATIPIDANKQQPRSLKNYMGHQATKDTLMKSMTYAILSVFITGTIVISPNWNNLLSLVVNIIFAISFGIKAMLDAETYVTTELIIWYKIKIEEATKGKEEKDGKSQRGNKKPRPRPANAGGVQQAEKPATGQSINNVGEPTQPAT